METDWKLRWQVIAVCGAISFFWFSEPARSAEVTSPVIEIRGEELFAGYPAKLNVVPANSIGISGWEDGYLIRTDNSTNLFVVAFKVLPDADAATREFFKLTIAESSGGQGGAAPNIGEQAVLLRPNRIMVRRRNVVITVFPKIYPDADHLERTAREVTSLSGFADEKIRKGGLGVVLRAESKSQGN